MALAAAGESGWRRLATLAASLLLLAGCGRPARPSLLLITIDTLRADHLSLYGYRRATSPRIDALAAQGVHFETVLSPIPQTGPAFASLMTGQWPAALGMRANNQRLRGGVKTLAEILSEQGYDTAGFVSGLPLDRRLAGLERGFAHFDDRMPDAKGRRKETQRLAPKTTNAVLAWVDARLTDRPYFLWVHFYDPHGDYAPGAPYDTMFRDGASGPVLAAELIPYYQRLGDLTDGAEYVRLYDAEIRRVDDELARLLDGMERRGLLANALVAVTADHGESLTEHGSYFDHGNELYLAALRVPLVLSGPGVPRDGRRIRGIALLPDLMPTLLERLGVAAPPDIAGVTLGEGFAEGSVVRSREALSEARFVAAGAVAANSDVTPKLAVRDERFTVIWRLAADRLEIYDRSADPEETRDLLAGNLDEPGAAAVSARPGPADSDPGLAADLRSAMTARIDAIVAGSRPEPLVLSPATRLRLERLATARLAGPP